MPLLRRAFAPVASLGLPLLLLAGLCAMAPDAAAQSRTLVTPTTTGDAACDAAAAAWRACIAASPKREADKAQANTEVDKFMRDVVDARGPHRPSITGACPRTRDGYEAMLRGGTCAGNTTGARDDNNLSRDTSPVPAPTQLRR
jgi:hypothetical protein